MSFAAYSSPPRGGMQGDRQADLRSVRTYPAPARLGVVLLLLAAVLWSLNGLFIKSLHDAGVSGWSIAGFRSLFACVFVTPFALRRLKPIQDRGWVFFTVLAFTGMCATFVISTTLTTAANAIILQYTAPAWVFVFAPLITGERATRQQFFGLTLSLVGVGVLFLWQYEQGQSGLIIGLASGVVFGIQSVLFRRVRALDPVVLVWLVCGGSAVLLLPVSYVTGTVDLTSSIVGWLVLMGVVQFGLPYVLYSAALSRVTAQQAVLIILLESILNPLWVWLVRGEVPHISTFIGGACILASVTYLAILQLAGSSRNLQR